MQLLRQLSADLLAEARAQADGQVDPAEPRPASTVVLLRDGDGAPGGLEVYLLRRHVDMAFAPGMCVFPGGGVDERDFDAAVGWVGPSAAEWASLLSTDEGFARALVCAAVRETFEESGVLLAGPTADTLVGDTTGADWADDRRLLEARELSFTSFLDRRGLRLRTDLLRVWGSWVTPSVKPRRFAAWFFVAQLPAGQVTQDVSTESDHALWLPVREAVRAVRGESMLMMLPTYCTCLELFGFTRTADALDAASDRDLTAVEPQVVLDGDGGRLTIPDRLVALDAAVPDPL